MPRRETRTRPDGTTVQTNTYGPDDADPDGVIRLPVVGIVIGPNGRATVQPQTQGDNPG